MTKPKLDKLKKEIERVEAVIVDEMSMVSADYLYNLHKRLMELFDSKDDFGGRALMLVGDLLQLPPVQARAIFKRPRSDKNKIIHDMTDANDKNIGNLWNNCQVVVLKTNFRQGNGNPWTELLNRVRKGEATSEDIQVLKSRKPSLLSQEEYDDATHVFFKNKDVYAHNLKMLRKLKTNMHEIRAKFNIPKGSNFTPPVNEWDIVGESNFSDNLQLKVGSRVMMVFNISINDLLVNGALGTVVGFEFSSSSSVEAIIVTFDNPEAGRQQRRDSPYAEKYSDQNGVPIYKHTIEEPLPHGKRNRSKGKVHGSTYKITQFPLRLAFASTTHKVQGVTIKAGSNLITHGDIKMPDAMYYVMLSRVSALGNVFNENFLPEKLTPNKDALEENAELEKRDITPSFKKMHFDFFVLNIRSLNKHLIDLKEDMYAQRSDHICIVESWMDPEKHTIERFQMEERSLHHSSIGKGKGCGIYSLTSKNVECQAKIAKQNYQILSIVDGNVQFVLLYCSSDCNFAEVVQDLEEIINEEKINVISGDFNYDKDDTNALTMYLGERNFEQIVKICTHDKGRTIDLCYVPVNIKDKFHLNQYSPFYSDHDALCISLDLE